MNGEIEKEGFYSILIKKAELLHDTATSKMDPYVTINLGNYSNTTKISRGSGKFPSWDENFLLRKEVGPKFEQYTHIEIKVFDSYIGIIGGDKIIGVYRLKTRNFEYEKIECNLQYVDNDEFKDAGVLFIEVNFIENFIPLKVKNLPDKNGNPRNINIENKLEINEKEKENINKNIQLIEENEIKFNKTLKSTFSQLEILENKMQNFKDFCKFSI